MILVLGGTTEGRVAVQALEEAGKPFYYSTKGNEQEVTLHHGIRLCGGMDAEAMTRFCREHGICLLVDAAHPFAGQLHQAVEQAADALRAPVVRLERVYDDGEQVAGSVIWCRDYAEAVRALCASGVSVLLALTGVQTIGRLKPLWQSGIRCHFRILDRDASRAIAAGEGFPADRLCYYHDGEDDRELMRRLSPDAILLKESGVSGGFYRKVEAARGLGIRVFAIRRPALPVSFVNVDGPHGLRREVERLLPGFYPLRSGLTTGTCAAAAAVAAVYGLSGQFPSEVPVRLPDGETIPVSVCHEGGERGLASVVKDAGDDPDITHGAVIRAKVWREESAAADEWQVSVRGGEGVGTVTLPGLGLPVGASAINDTPRRQIRENVIRALERTKSPAGRYVVTVSVPEGEALAGRTFNPRLGVTGGISIIGTSGIVKPFSSEAFVQSVRKSMEVARATGSPLVVIGSGARSERFLRARYPGLPPQAFVHYGNFIGEAVKAAARLHVPRLALGLMIGKAVKLAEGHLDTHSKHVAMNKAFVRQVAAEAGCSSSTLSAVDRITLARELWDVVPADELQPFVSRLLTLCRLHCAPLLPEGELTVLLIAEDGRIYEP